MSGGGTIYEYQREVTARLEQALRERDEARAEVERLQGVVDAAALGVSEMLAKFSDKERYAYRRGAEAMREAAAQEVCGYSVTVFNPFGERVRVNTDGLGGVGDIIRALPIPEDK